MNEQKITIKGLSTAALFTIPALLAVAAILWLSFGEEIHVFNRSVSQEKRHAEAVGAATLPTAPYSIVIKNKPRECRVIDRAEIDGTDLWVYWHKNCSGTEFREGSDTIRWSLVSPNNTIIASGFEYTHVDPAIGQQAEFHTEIRADPRAVAIELKARWNDSE
jgi:hypothetical protein